MGKVMNVDVMVPSLREVTEFLVKQSTSVELFGSIPIGSTAIVCLECLGDGTDFLLHANEDAEAIECRNDAYTSWDEIYMADTDVELRAVAHRMISRVRDSLEEEVRDENFSNLSRR